MARQRALDDVAKKSQAVERADCVDSCHVERAINETYFKITFNVDWVPTDFLDDYGLEFRSMRIVGADSIFGELFWRKRPMVVAVEPEDGSP